ncbi:hypothetical protein L1S34_04290 [Flavobacterium sp. K77]|uniref:hypothetical protein n=1 Tax=Flavobacterium sp. K77 TaxID=2910676 RepID=UPI001F36FE6B|nr:hypothetical protein [Flavobacterium sp. K77]MCF6140497.1 hypothetical protein [Flavobacterium sp. K77]
MPKYSKESLGKLLVLIDEICKEEENLWFKESLKNKFHTTDDLHNSEINIKLSSIEKYLKIDGIKIIDYSEIENLSVRNQLFRDCIEMSKYRLGRINDTINFDEYCRYGHMQAEELINYYYNEKFYGNLDYIQEFILKNFSIYKLNNNLKSINQISYYAKLSAFIKAYELEKGPLKATIEFLSSLRNELSHRNSSDINNEDLILRSIKNLNIDVSNSYIDYKKYSKEDLDLFKKGRFIYLKRKQDYDEIIENLNYLKEAIILVLKN